MTATRNLMLICLIEAMLHTSAAVVQAQFTFVTNNGSITITAYTGTNDTVVIPNMTNGYSVTSIGEDAFFGNFTIRTVLIEDGIASIGDLAFVSCTNLAFVTIPTSVTNIGVAAFWGCGFTSFEIPANVALGISFISYCLNLTNVIIANGVNGISEGLFSYCSALTSVAIPNSVTFIGNGAFGYCANLTSIVIPSSVTSIGYGLFDYCNSLQGVYFKGNAPSFGSLVSLNDTNFTVYYLPGTTGWSTNYGGASTAFWHLPYPVILDDMPSLGIRTNRFGFTTSWATNVQVKVDACTNLFNAVWEPIGTNTLTNGTSHFSDSQWTNYTFRFYRLSSP